MNQYKKGMSNHQFSCEICEITSMSNAEYALHEFTKKHCDNLIRVAKNKPILKKQKTKDKTSEVEKETVKANTVIHSGSFAKYGYFIPGEVYTTAKVPTEFNLDYDPYLQKFAESSKEETTPLIREECQQSHIRVVTPVARSPEKKKKKKNNIKTCEICNVELLTASYTAHMKSPEHILKLKVSGMGVSAHFVKSSSDLHTIETKEDQEVCQDLISSNGKATQHSSPSAMPSPTCNTNELPFHSSHQYTASIPEKHFAEGFTRTVEGKKIELSKTEKLFCYTCNKALNTLFQYNEHKNGRKHKSRCRALINKGLTIPPEERVPEFPNNDTGQPVYPPRYALMIAERQKNSTSPIIEYSTGSRNARSNLESPAKPDLCDDNITLTSFNKKSGNNVVATEIQDESNCECEVSKPVSNYDELGKKSNFTFHKIKFVVAEPSEEPNSEKSSVSEKNFYTNKTAEDEDINSADTDDEHENKIIVLSSKESLHCSLCNEHFQWPLQFDKHLTKEEHLQKIVDLKVSGKGVREILDLIFADRNFIKPTVVGKLLCSICKIAVNNELEFKQHLNCIVHKYMKKDFRNKITLEVKELIPCDRTGKYYCKVCRIKLGSLVEFRQHIFSAEHIGIKKRKGNAAKYRRFRKSLKRKADKNPEERKAYDVRIGGDAESGGLKYGNKISSTSQQNWLNADVPHMQNLTQGNSGPSPPSLISSSFLPPKNHFPYRLPPNICLPRVKIAPPPFYISYPPTPSFEENFH